jgi:hypothetical protein
MRAVLLLLTSSIVPEAMVVSSAFLINFLIGVNEVIACGLYPASGPEIPQAGHWRSQPEQDSPGPALRGFQGLQAQPAFCV